MLLKALTLQNFRRFQALKLQFDRKINLLFGANGAGKTSVLEAVFFLMVGRSFRTPHSLDLIEKSSSQFIVEGVAETIGVSQTLKIAFGPRTKKILLNQTPLTSFSQLLGTLQGVAITPDDIQLIKGSPQGRRDFIDLQIAQTDPVFVYHLARYYKAMTHKNALLRRKQTQTLESFEHQMAKSASYIVEKRERLIKSLETKAHSIFSDLYPGRGPLTLLYNKDKVDAKATEEFFLSEWKKFRAKELMLGYTVVGPHKHELSILLGGRPAKQFSSEGEKKGCVLALKFAEWSHLKLTANVPPLLLIDDFSASLDITRQTALLELISQCGQVFISCTELPDNISLKGQAFQL